MKRKLCLCVQAFLAALILSSLSIHVASAHSSVRQSSSISLGERIAIGNAKAGVVLKAFFVPPPPPPDTTVNAFKKLRVLNLGPVVNSGKGDFAPTVTADGRTMFLVSERSGSRLQDFFSTTSPENNDTTWAMPANETLINSAVADGAASIAADGQTIYFATNRSDPDAPNNVDIWVASLDGKEWKNLREIGAPINTTKWETQPAISPDGKKLFFASNREGKIGDQGNKNIDIFMSRQFADGRWSEPVNLGSKINTPDYDGAPFLAADGQTLYFATNGRGGLGNLDIFFSEFKGPSDTDWTVPVALPAPINSPADDAFLTVPASGNVMFFASKRDGGSGMFDIYVAFNPPPPKASLVIRGVCYDMHTQEKLAANVVIVQKETGDTLYNKQANSATGEYLCVVPPNVRGECGGTFIISAREPNHFPYGPTNLEIAVRNDTSRIVTHDIPMDSEEPPVVAWVTETPRLIEEFRAANKLTGSKFDGMNGVVIREKATIELFPLLPMVFFDEGQSNFPSRYVLFNNAGEAAGYTEDTVTSTLNGYWNYLNILGRRLKMNPSTKITIVGCNAENVPAEKSLELSRQRAENVKKYLVDIWGIDPNRMAVEARNRPEIATLPTTPEGIEENRRVEIHWDDWEIGKPIKFEDNVKEPDRPTVKFSMKNGLRLEKIASRELVISRSGQEWYRIKDLGDLTMTTSPEWNWRSMSGALPEDEADFSVQLLVTDKTGRVVKSNVANADVRQFTQKDVSAERMADKTREKYNLILFKYASSEMGKWNRKILDEYVFTRIKPNSDVQVNGYTDILGTPDYNLKLSQQRADASRKAIDEVIRGKVKSINSKGYGKTEPLYPNELPEGRYYNRTVQVFIETPINNP
jgi:outer membrane protein OmpA-like peptidoglycan-associated protein/Tol biopolymer transport system component